MKTVKLPCERLFVCETCGNSSRIREAIEQCELTPTAERPSVKIGEVVPLYHPIYEGRQFRGVSARPTPWTVVRLFYARPNLRFLLPAQFEDVRPHQLCIELTHLGEPNLGTREMTYAHFRLWEMGGLEGLRSAGLIPKESGEGPHLTLVTTERR